MWKKVIAPAIVVSLFWIVVSVATTYGIYQLSRSHDRILGDNVRSIRSVGELEESLWKMHFALFSSPEAGGGDASRDANLFEEQFEQSMKSAQRAATTDSAQALIEAIRERFVAYRDYSREALRRSKADPASIAAARDQATRLAHKVTDSCAKFLQHNEGLLNEAVHRNSRLERWLYVLRLAFLVAGPLFGIWVGLRTARGFQSSISQICVTLNDASGKLNQEIGIVDVSPKSASDDLPALNQQVQTISLRIREVLSELQHARQDAIRSDRLAAVGEIAAGIAHEIRNPLTSVKLLIQTAPRDGSGIQLQDRHSEVMLQEISRMENTIQALLDFARPPVLRRVEHDLRDTLRRAMNLVDGKAAHQGVVLTADFAAAPLLVDADPEQIHQVFVNLFINGIESMEWGGKLEITAGISDDLPGICRVVVNDSGTGIPPDRLRRIFDPFMTTKERGTGLGLAISRRIVNEHNGEIFAGNRGEGGATFTVELPLAKSPAVAAASPRAAASAPGAVTATARI